MFEDPEAMILREQEERQYGAVRGLPQKTVNCRKQAIFRKLKISL